MRSAIKRSRTGRSGRWFEHGSRMRNRHNWIDLRPNASNCQMAAGTNFNTQKGGLRSWPLASRICMGLKDRCTSATGACRLSYTFWRRAIDRSRSPRIFRVSGKKRIQGSSRNCGANTLSMSGGRLSVRGSPFAVWRSPFVVRHSLAPQPLRFRAS